MLEDFLNVAQEAEMEYCLDENEGNGGKYPIVVRSWKERSVHIDSQSVYDLTEKGPSQLDSSPSRS